MKRFFALIFATAFSFTVPLFVACSDSNPSSGTNDPGSYDVGEGYTIAAPFRFDETKNIVYQEIYSCYYHHDSKTFTWEENIEPIDMIAVKIVGDSMWLGPSPKEYDPEDYYYNYEKLALSSNHDGIYGTWEFTGCTRVIGKTEIKCDIYINSLAGISQTLKITKDSIYNTFKHNPATAKAFRDTHWNIPRIIEIFFFDDNTNFVMDPNTFEKNVKIIDESKFVINNQVFEYRWIDEFNDMGFGDGISFTSNGKTCKSMDFMGGITESLCKEGNSDILLSGRDKAFDEDYYKEGPIHEFFTLRNTEEFQECMQTLITPETKAFLHGQL